MGWAPRFLTTVPFLAAAPTTGTLRRRRGWYDSSPSPPWGAGLRVTFIGGIFAVQLPASFREEAERSSGVRRRNQPSCCHHRRLPAGASLVSASVRR
nr:unnamed protein product [Digitaria exilis]